MILYDEGQSNDYVRQWGLEMLSNSNKTSIENCRDMIVVVVRKSVLTEIEILTTF